LPSNESENKTIEEKIDIFKEHNIEKIWVTTKHPFVTYLFIAIFPLIVIGDPIAIILSFI
jgi:prepilin signal peptidase PulO-like enzyme (type II secretory pathway)